MAMCRPRVHRTTVVVKPSSAYADCSSPEEAVKRMPTQELPSLFAEPVTISMYANTISAAGGAAESVMYNATKTEAGCQSNTADFSVMVVNSSDLWFGDQEIHNPIWSETPSGRRVIWTAEDNSFDASPLEKPLCGDVIFALDGACFRGMVTFPTESGNPTNYLIDGTKGAQPKSVMYDLTKAAETAPSLLMVVIGNDIFFGQTKIENAQWTAAAAGGRAVSWTDAAQDDDASAPSSGHLIFAADGASVQGNFVHAGTAYSATGAVRESGDVSVWELYQGVLSMLQEPELRPRIEEAFLELESQQKYREYTCDVAEASAACIVTVAGQRLWVNGIEAHNVAWQQLPDGAARVLWYPQDNDADSAPGGKPHAADVTFTLDMSAFSGTCQQAEPNPVITFRGTLATRVPLAPENAYLRLLASLRTPQERKEFAKRLTPAAPGEQSTTQLEAVALLCDEDHTVCRELPFRRVGRSAFTLTVAPEAMRLPVDGPGAPLPPRAHNVQAIIIAISASSGDFTSCPLLRVTCRSSTSQKTLVDWDVECGSGNTGYVPAVLYQPRKEPAAASHWCITGVGAEEKCARSWRESSVTLGALRGLIPDPSALHELLVVRVVSADLRKVCNCRVELALFPCTAATAVVTQTCSPRFDKTFLLTYAPGVPLDVCVKDVGRLWDAVVGTVHIDLQAAPADGGKPVSQRCVPLVPTPEAPYTLLDSHHEAVGTLRLGIYLARSISRHKII
eukprot:TRINITY_DN2054_c0_g1_i2.p1 TRINITY_DN2054_c0_g1~~TRINITY_DN2054_c0_g1_i2.p1  ORF type:complete len:735 (-),score=152.21 TRINITY_DN2054_c0_g1_i2:23-2227(-)